MTTTNIEINGNRLSCRIEFTDAEDYFVKRHIWNAVTVEGKDAEISEGVPATAYYSEGVISLEMACEKETTAMDAYDAMLGYNNAVKKQLGTELNRYFLVREQWEPALTMTLKALGLVAIDLGDKKA